MIKAPEVPQIRIPLEASPEETVLFATVVLAPSLPIAVLVAFVIVLFKINPSVAVLSNSIDSTKLLIPPKFLTVTSSN